MLSLRAGSSDSEPNLSGTHREQERDTVFQLRGAPPIDRRLPRNGKHCNRPYAGRPNGLRSGSPTSPSPSLIRPAGGFSDAPGAYRVPVPISSTIPRTVIPAPRRRPDAPPNRPLPKYRRASRARNDSNNQPNFAIQAQPAWCRFPFPETRTRRSGKSFPKKVRNFRVNFGKTFPKSSGGVLVSEDGDFTSVVAASLWIGFGNSPAARKSLMRITGAGQRTVKNRLEGKNAPNGANPVELARHSDEVLETFLMLAGREEILTMKRVMDAHAAAGTHGAPISMRSPQGSRFRSGGGSV